MSLFETFIQKTPGPSFLYQREEGRIEGRKRNGSAETLKGGVGTDIRIIQKKKLFFDRLPYVTPQCSRFKNPRHFYYKLRISEQHCEFVRQVCEDTKLKKKKAKPS